MMERYICIHCHFYQPPRENPWLESIEIQDSAYPYHDWNERITSECYAPNSAARIVNGNGKITGIVSNYSKISFNFGPTLLAWMQASAPIIYREILEADKLSASERSGHGNAIAQVYNHVIMPLANSRDKCTQIRWGIKDFQHRFGRLPEGMWLAETAVDLETLEYLAREGIRFTILAPHQARRVRKRTGFGKWKDVSGARIDPTRPYLIRLPSGQRISIFFYDGPISRAVAFENLLGRGEDLAARLVSGFSDQRDWSQFMHIATDGETYGHHRRFGDMALAYALHHIEKNGLARLTNYGEYLEKFPPDHEVQIYENTSWSCAHGIERWRSDCGCNSGGHPQWNQGWRAPLRDALDWLRDEIADRFATCAPKYLSDPWAARDDYVSVILERNPATIEAFLSKHCSRTLSPDERITVLKLLEAQRHSLLMYTSCGWFFDELSGIETVQVMQYADRAIQLVMEVCGGSLQETFTAMLAKAKSNIREYSDGGHIYDRLVRPATIDLKKVAVHYAVSSVIEDFGERAEIFSFNVEREDYFRIPAGTNTLIVGNALVTSRITGDSERISFSVLHTGGHAFNGGARQYLGNEAFHAMKEETSDAFEKGDIAGVVHAMDARFGMHNYSFRDLFRDRQHKILSLLVKETLEKQEDTYRGLFETEQVLMNVLAEAGIPVPNVFRAAAEYTLNLDLKNAFSQDVLDGNAIMSLIGGIEKWNLSHDILDTELIIRKRLERDMTRLQKNPENIPLIDAVRGTMALARLLPFQINLWEPQNMYYDMTRSVYSGILKKSGETDENALKWIEAFRGLGESLDFDLGAIVGS